MNVMHYEDSALIDLGGGATRRILAHEEGMMIVEVAMETGAVGAPHTHPHVQSTYVKEGRFRFTVAGEDTEVACGDTLVFTSGILHGCVCLEKGVLIDIFAPMREDFLQQ